MLASEFMRFAEDEHAEGREHRLSSAASSSSNLPSSSRGSRKLVKRRGKETMSSPPREVKEGSAWKLLRRVLKRVPGDSAPQGSQEWAIRTVPPKSSACSSELRRLPEIVAHERPGFASIGTSRPSSPRGSKILVVAGSTPEGDLVAAVPASPVHGHSELRQSTETRPSSEHADQVRSPAVESLTAIASNDPKRGLKRTWMRIASWTPTARATSATASATSFSSPLSAAHDAASSSGSLFEHDSDSSSMTTETVTDSPEGRSQPYLQPLISTNNDFDTEHLEPSRDDLDDPTDPTDPDEPSEEGLPLDDDLIDESHPERQLGDLSPQRLPQVDEVDEDQEWPGDPEYELGDEPARSPEVRHLHTSMVSSGSTALLPPAALGATQPEEDVEQAVEVEYYRRASTLCVPRLSTIYEFDEEGEPDEDEDEDEDQEADDGGLIMDEEDPMDDEDSHPRQGLQHDQPPDSGFTGQPEQPRSKRKLRSMLRSIFSRSRPDLAK